VNFFCAQVSTGDEKANAIPFLLGTAKVTEMMMMMMMERKMIRKHLKETKTKTQTRQTCLFAFMFAFIKCLSALITFFCSSTTWPSAAADKTKATHKKSNNNGWQTN